uniref:dynamin-related protein 4C-like n=1 Tax=Erigeron canadensis TaxID=72917 RepID=UPI001CB9C84B|nr:dynamin-related protein 4C-like [Erigeron canadensis]
MADFNQTLLPPLVKEIKERFNKPINELFETLIDFDVIERRMFPKIIVVGDANVGKTSVVSKLVGVDLPREIGIPFTLSFQYHDDPLSKMFLSYDNYPLPVKKEVSQDDLESEITEAVKSLPAYWSKSRSNFTVIVMQPYVSNLNIVLLPGLKNYPHDDKAHVDREIEILDGYVKNQPRYGRCIFLHVVSAPDFHSNLSMKYFNRAYYKSHVVTVVTNLESCSDPSIIAQLTTQKVGFWFDEHSYLFVETSSSVGKEGEKCKQLVEEMYKKCDEEAAAKEEFDLDDEEGDFGFEYLFVESSSVVEDEKGKHIKEDTEKHEEVTTRVDEKSEGIEQGIQNKYNVFSKIIDGKYCGYDVVAKSLVDSMLSMLFNWNSEIYEGISRELEKTAIKRRQLEERFDSFSEALPTMLSVVDLASRSLSKLFVDKMYEEYENESSMHAAAMMKDKFDMFQSLLLDPSIHINGKFLDEEYKLLVSRYDDFLPPPAPGMLHWLLNKLISNASSISKNFSATLFIHMNDVVAKVLVDHAKHHRQLYSPLKLAAQRVLAKMQWDFNTKVDALLNMEKNVILTCQPGYKAKWDRLKSIELKIADIEKKVVDIEGLGRVEVGHLAAYDERRLKVAFSLKMRIVCYWEFVVNRFVDYAMLNLMSSMEDMMSKYGFNIAMKDNLTKSSQDESIKLPNLDPELSLFKFILENKVDHLNKVKKEIEILQHREYD